MTRISVVAGAYFLSTIIFPLLVVSKSANASSHYHRTVVPRRRSSDHDKRGMPSRRSSGRTRHRHRHRIILNDDDNNNDGNYDHDDDGDYDHDRDGYDHDHDHKSLIPTDWEESNQNHNHSNNHNNQQWEEPEESSYNSSSDEFVDIGDLGKYRPVNNNNKRKSKRMDTVTIDTKKAERILVALEQNGREDENAMLKRTATTTTKRKQKRRKKANAEALCKSSSLSSSSSLPKSKKKRRKKRRKRQITSTTSISNSSACCGVDGISLKNNNANARDKHNDNNYDNDNDNDTTQPKRIPLSTTSSNSNNISNDSGIPSTSKNMADSVVSPTTINSYSSSPPKSHPDRTTWEVPSYSHKISTMMKNSNNKSKVYELAASNNLQTTRATTTTTAKTIPRATSGSNSIGSRMDPATTTTTTTTGGSVIIKTRKATTSAAAPARASGTAGATTQRPSATSSTSSGTTPWVRKFLAGRSKDRLLPLPKDYISDNFNLAQLPPIVERVGYEAMGENAISVAKALQRHRIAIATGTTAAAESNGIIRQTQSKSASSYPIYRRALRRILEEEAEGDIDTNANAEEDLIIPPYAIQKAAEALFLMLHARFIVSPRGLEAIRHVMALDNTVFGKCPRSTCRGTGLLPYGYSNDYTTDPSVPVVTAVMRKEHDSCCHRYCPSCGEVWISWDSKADGCAWGPSWCHLFLLSFGTQVYANELAEAAGRRGSSSMPSSLSPSPYGLSTQSMVSPSLSRSFLPRGSTRDVMATNPDFNDIGLGVEPDTVSSRPTPSVFGFRIHPATAFGRPLNEPSLGGGS